MTKKEINDNDLGKISGGNNTEGFEPDILLNDDSYFKKSIKPKSAPGWRFRAEANTDGQYFKIKEEIEDN